MIFDTSPLLAHVAGVPVEEVLPGVLACGAVGVHLAADYVKRRLPWRDRRQESRRAEGRPPT
jgi:hypothetical protein